MRSTSLRAIILGSAEVDEVARTGILPPRSIKSNVRRAVGPPRRKKTGRRLAS